jgi:hypothetical protein
MLVVLKRASIIFFEDKKCSYKELGVRESWAGFGFINRFSGGFFLSFFLFVGIYN